ncbi:MAG: FAD-binding oxidoreductase [Pseudomonadota bacterium]
MTLQSAFRDLLGARAVTNRDVLDRHGKDESFHAARAPDLVVYPESNEEVQEIVRRCHERRVPMIPFGAGTSLEGHIAALHGGGCIDMSLMNHVLEVNTSDLDCRVQAGVTRKQLNGALADEGIFFPVDPGADATIGGMTATRASGTNAVRYGTMRENLLGLTVVLADGRIIRTGGRSRKSAAGYDLTRLFCGSEGTLGIITEVQLRCYGRPEASAVGVCAFDTVAGAVDAVIEVIQAGIPVARVEFLDAVQMGAVNRYSGLSCEELPTLFFEFHGTHASVHEQSEQTALIVAAHGGGDFTWSTRTEEQSALWQARHDAYYAARAVRPGTEGWPTDVCVPISRLTACIVETQADLARFGVIAPIVGHVGDGNFHLLLLVDRNDPGEMAVAQEINDRLVRRAIAMGGTSTGEHGIGYGKLEYLRLEHGSAVEVMATIKQALDPLGLMNPGKIIAPAL